LIRNIALYKLTKVLNLETFAFLSEVGDKIFVLLNIDKNSLSLEAERIHYPLQFESGSTDLLSLEPTNDNLVPLRYCNLNKPVYIKHLESNLRDFYQVLYENDRNYLS